MRDIRFVAEHRGGILNSSNHKKLMHWAIECSEHILHLLGDNTDYRLTHALHIANAWQKGKATTGEAMKASVEAHFAARKYADSVSKAVARSIGHAVATAHMADHSLGAAIYALLAIKYSGGPVLSERNWQNNRIPEELKEQVLSLRTLKEGGFKDLREIT